MSSGMINSGYKYATALRNRNLGIIMLELEGSIGFWEGTHFYQLAKDMSS